MSTSTHCIRCIDPTKYPGASLISVAQARKDTGLSEAETRKASKLRRIGRTNYVHIEEVNTAVRQFEGGVSLPPTRTATPIDPTPGGCA